MRTAELTEVLNPAPAGDPCGALGKGAAPGKGNASEQATANTTGNAGRETPVGGAGRAVHRWMRRLSPTTPFASPATACAAGLGIAASLFCLTLVTYFRAIQDGSLASDNSHLPIKAYLTVVVSVTLCCLAVGYFYFRAWNTPQHFPLERLLLVALAIHCCAFPAMPLTGDDLFVNLANGRVLQCGLNPYLNTPADLGPDEFNALVPQVWLHWITPYGPINIWLSRLTVSAGGLWPSIWAFKSAMLAAAIAMVLLAYGFCRTCLPAERRAQSFILLAWNPLLAWELSAQSHNDGPMLVFATAFVWAAFARREWLSSGLLIAAFYAKFAVAPILGLHLCCRARHSWWRAAATVAALLAAGVCLYYPFWYGSKTLTNSLVEARAENWHIINSFIALACDSVEPYSPALKLNLFSAWSLVCQVSFLGLAAWYAWRAKTVTRVIRDPLLSLLLYETIGKGWFLPWYVTWLLPLAMAETDVRLQRIAAVYSLLVLLLYIPSGIGIPIAHGTVVLMVWHYLRSDPSSVSQPDSSLADTQPICVLARAQAA